jgi:hypothetical protein
MMINVSQIMTTDPAVFKHVLVDDFDTFVKGESVGGRESQVSAHGGHRGQDIGTIPEWSILTTGSKFRSRAKDFLGDGIFNSDGER